jgi:hypothetical protein
MKLNPPACLALDHIGVILKLPAKRVLLATDSKQVISRNTFSSFAGSYIGENDGFFFAFASIIFFLLYFFASQ